MRTLVLGATNNPQRYAYLAVNNLLEQGHEVIPVGVKDAEVAGLKIKTDKTIFPDVDTLTLYVGPKNQARMVRLHT
jgi:predicted CoA-binding protein